ncbi:histidine kinase [Streptomyces sp. C10-9-1]|uniref:sensor histidine kinase n=1 Tax=Streptomyces sp. C10-9-1 TaxID=1859285 RepID=UPI002111C157|nr:histidine kinase [Streptomyces sp. C10-9-1]MCQ6551770.1 histidine kinase [Streptomyces sp. C10-9-1]
MTRTEYPWLLPSAMAEPPERGPAPGGRPRPRRTVRDWVVDSLVFLLAAGIGLLAGEAVQQADTPEALVAADLVAGAAACGALWVRRRFPVALAVGALVVGVLAPTAGGASMLALFSLAVHRPFRPVAAVGVLAAVSAVVQPLVRPDPGASYPASVVAGLVLVLLMVGWGMLVRSRRELFRALRERARRAEAEAALRAEQAQRLAREAIAREMHDVLAHRLTLLSVHAGALEFRPGAPAAEVARAAGVIRDSAHEALQDLREIIGVLRAPGDDGGAPDRPRPTLAALGALVEESRGAGMDVVLDSDVPDPGGVPASTGRTAYRIAQEALTNARKHAPGTAVRVVVRGRPGDGLSVEVANPAPAGEVQPVPGSGQGLIGLTERAVLAGGRLEHGGTGEGGFRVAAWLPWPP